MKERSETRNGRVEEERMNNQGERMKMEDVKREKRKNVIAARENM